MLIMMKEDTLKYPKLVTLIYSDNIYWLARANDVFEFQLYTKRYIQQLIVSDSEIQ